MEKKISLDCIEKGAKVFGWALVVVSLGIFVWMIVLSIQEFNFENVFSGLLAGVCTVMSTAMMSNWTFGKCKTKLGQRIAVKLLEEQ